MRMVAEIYSNSFYGDKKAVLLHSVRQDLQVPVQLEAAY